VYKPGGGDDSPLHRAKPFFGQSLSFSGNKQCPKMEKNYFVVFIKQKMIFLPSSKMKCLKNALLSLIIARVGRTKQF